MTLGSFLALFLSLVGSLTAGNGRQGTDDPKLRAAVDRFFAMQQAEDVAGYLSLWSATAKRPTAEQLKYVFEAGDDTFSDIAIVGTFPAGDRVRVRVSATRDRVSPARIPGRPPFTSHTTTAWSLTYVREGDDWKLVREGTAADDLADSLIEAQTPEDREKLLLAEPELVDRQPHYGSLTTRGAGGAGPGVPGGADRIRAHARRGPARRQQEAGGRGAAEPCQRDVLSAQPAGRSAGV